MAFIGVNSISGASPSGGTGSQSNTIDVINTNATLASDAYIYNMNVYIGAGGGLGQNVRCVIYADSGGAPGAFVAATQQQSIFGPLALAWVSFTFANYYQLLPAGSYWLGLWYGPPPVGVSSHMTVGTTMKSQNSTYTTSGSPVNPFGTPSASGSAAPVIYANYTTDLQFPAVSATASAVTDTPGSSVPLCAQLPQIAGVPVVGQTQVISPGIWSGSPTVTQQWQRNGSNISSATGLTYTLVSADDTTTVAPIVTATGTNGKATTTTPDQPVIGASRTVTWDPTQRQQWDPDTVYLFDPDIEKANFPFTNTGLVNTAGAYGGVYGDQDPWGGGSPFTTTPFKYRTGVYGRSDNSFLFAPGIYIPSNSFTVECRVRCDNASWAAANGGRFLACGGNGGLIIDSGPSVIFNNTAVSQHYTINGVSNPTPPVAMQEVSCAATFDGTTLKFYVDGVLQGSQAVTAPRFFDVDDRSDGIQINNGNTGRNPLWAVADVRISRTCRTPGVPVTVTSANTVTITDTATGSMVQQNLLAGLHYYSKTTADITNSSVIALAQGFATVGRTDKILSAVPIKAGGTDGTHPTLGHSGSFSYDWRPVDHLLTYYTAVGLKPYLGFDSTPQILGGVVAPFTPTLCADPTQLPGFSGFNEQVPSSFASFATICADLYYYVTVTKATTVPYWSVWNEPNGSFWGGTQLQMFDLYAAIANAVKAVDPAAHIGGLECIGDGWNADHIAYCAAHNTPLDFVSVHIYSGAFGFYQVCKLGLAAACAANNFPVPELVIGECGWQSANYPGASNFGNIPPNNYVVGDFGAAFRALTLMENQLQGYSANVFTGLNLAETTDGSYGANGLISSTHPWATGNVHKMWARLG